jgi:hypothetical protein
MTLTLLAMLTACDQSKPDYHGDSGLVAVDPNDTDDTNSSGDCDITLDNTTPSSGASSWFYRDQITLTFSDSNPTFSLSVTDSSGADVAVDTEWDDGRLNAYVLPTSGAWAGSESYTVSLDLCGLNPSFSFSTNEYGTPLEVEASALVGNTYLIDLSAASYSEPPGIGTLLGLFLDAPLLLGVASVDGSNISFLATQGVLNELEGTYEQIPSFPVWDFSNADFSESPYFAAQTALLNVDYSGTDIPIHDFDISGTFSSDGSMIGGAQFRGTGDTRNMGPLLNLGNNPNAVCELVGDYGVECLACPDDNEPYCIIVAGEIDEADLINGLTLEQ